MAESNDSNDPFSSVHREQRVRVILLGAAAMGLVAMVIGVAAAVFSAALDENPAAVSEAASPAATPSVPSPAPSTTTLENPSPSVDEEPAQAATSTEVRILNENRQVVVPQVGMCVGRIDNGTVSDGPAIFIVPCTWPKVSFILAILNLPPNATSDDAFIQFVYDECFVDAAVKSLSDGDDGTDGDDGAPITIGPKPIDWIKDERGDFQSMGMSQNGFRYTAFFAEDGLILCTESSTIT